MKKRKLNNAQKNLELLPIECYPLFEMFLFDHDVIKLLRVSSKMKANLRNSSYVKRSHMYCTQNYTSFSKDVIPRSLYFIMNRLQFLQTYWSFHDTPKKLSYCLGHPIRQVLCVNSEKKQSIRIAPNGISARLDIPKKHKHWEVTIVGIICKIYKQYDTIASKGEKKHFSYVGSIAKLLFQLIQNGSEMDITIDFEPNSTTNYQWVSERHCLFMMSRDIRLHSSSFSDFNRATQNFDVLKNFRFRIQTKRPNDSGMTETTRTKQEKNEENELKPSKGSSEGVDEMDER